MPTLGEYLDLESSTRKDIVYQPSLHHVDALVMGSLWLWIQNSV
jgi:hypothetical protein